MHTLPDLSQLSHEQKDELIGLLFGQVQELMAQVQTLTVQVQAQQKRIEELQGRLGLDSTNSSPPALQRWPEQTRAQIPAQTRPAPLGGKKATAATPCGKRPSPTKSSPTRHHTSARHATLPWSAPASPKCAKSSTCPRCASKSPNIASCKRAAAAGKCTAGNSQRTSAPPCNTALKCWPPWCT